ncbi:MAG TPA: hypothetical protein VFQ38_23085 [Longimicrobiales bacterium]|nr:hypothetical protein [Longimicrobiales bacterium]
MEREPDATPPPARAITRRQLELVIRRAVELAAPDTDADERIPEDEVLRIAAELGLQPRHVQQALYEIPVRDPARAPGFIQRAFGEPTLQAQRAVPGNPPALLRRLDEYLTTREYLQLRRRQGEKLLFAPADDAISGVARALARPASRFHLARASRVLLTVRPLEPGYAHVRLDVDLGDQQRHAVRLGAATGFGLGVGLATAAGIAGAAIGALVGGPAAIVAGAILAGAVGLAGGFTGGVALLANRFRRRAGEAAEELEGLLDRIERGERLEPPPSPFFRRLQRRLGLLPPPR